MQEQPGAAVRGDIRIWVLLCLLLAASWPVSVGAQRAGQDLCVVDVREFNLNSGLYHHLVRDIFQDSRGVIWLATETGLNAYDGFVMHKVYEWPINPLRTHLHIRIEDRQGRLWIFLENDEGLPFLLVNIHTWTVSLPGDVVSAEQLGRVMDVSEDSEGRIQLLNRAGEIWRFEKNNRWQKLFALPTPARWSFCMPDAPDFSLVFVKKTTSSGNVMDSILLYKDNGQVLASGSIPFFHHAVFQPLQKELLVVGANQLLRGDVKGNMRSEKLVSVFPSMQADMAMEDIRIVTTGQNEGFWLFYDGQLRWLSTENRSVQLVVQQTYMPFNLAGIVDMMPDNQGNLWVATFEGLKKVRRIPNYFERINWLNPLLNAQYFRNASRGMTEDKMGRVYLQSGRSAYSYDPTSRQVKEIYRSRNSFSPLVYSSSDNTVWMCFDKLIAYEVGSAKVREIALPLAMQHATTWAMYNRTNQLLIASEGLWIYDKTTGGIHAFDKYNQFSELIKATVYHIDELEAGKLWLYTNLGVYLLDWDTGVRERYGSTQKGRYYLPAIHFHHGHIDRQGIHWLSSQQGLVRWDRQKNEYRLFTTKDGLPDNTIYAVYEDEQGQLWMSSNYGIIQFDPRTEAKRIFTVEDGITHNEFNRISHLQTKDGKLYFGGLNGITSFHPRQFYIGDYAAASMQRQVVLMSARVGAATEEGRNILPEYYGDKQIVMKPGDQYVRLQFALPDFSKSENIYYHYRIGGDDEAWVQTKTPVIQLLGLGYGTNILQIYAVSGDGSYQSDVLEVPIVVKLPFYLSPLFLLGLLVALVLAVREGLQFRLRQARRRQQELEREVERRTAKINEDKLLIEKQAKELEYTNRQKTLFFSNVTHEFRTPLSLVMSPVRLLMGSRKLSRRERGLLSIAKKNAARLLDMVEDILMLTTLETHNIKQRVEAVEPVAFVDMLLQEYQSLVAQKGLTLSSELKNTSDVQSVMLDGRLFRIIINNLLSNAIKFTSAGGCIHLSMEQSAERVVLSVADTGRGIRPADISRVFDRFFQTSDSNAPAEGGTGIGLALVKELTEILGGTIRVESIEGKGSTFKVDLPVRAVLPHDIIPINLPAAQERDEKDTQPSYQRTGYSILIVEDNYDFQEYLEYLLGDSYEIRQAYNGQAALDILNEGYRPSLIITDWMMPVMDGFQLKALLLKNNETAAIPVLMLTARAADSDKVRALRLGIDDYLVKPFDELSLLAAVETLISRHEARNNSESTLLSQTENTDSQLRTEQEWLQQLMDETNQRLSKETFSVDELAAAMFMGRTNFFKETKRLTGLSPNQYILEARLVRARYLMETQSNLNLKKVIQQVGLKHESHFVKVFKKRFGHPPSHYL